jgi:C4-dicarboxylate-specific signal transduction histidine kinase
VRVSADKEQSRAALREPYYRLVQEFVSGGSEDHLYQASLLAREAIQAGLGPQDVVEVHSAVLERLLEAQPPADLPGFFGRASSLLLEMMVVYAEAHQQIREVLATLEHNYAALEQTRGDLERSQAELRERTAQLVQRGKMTALGELSAGLIHEVNQPLNAIGIVVQDVRRDLQRNRLDVDGLRPSLNDIAEQVARIADIVGHLRIYSRRAEGPIAERLDIRAPIEGVFKILGEQLRIRGIQVEKELPPGLEVVGDTIRLEQVFMNLVINARDALQRRAEDEPRRLVLRSFAQGEPPAREVVCEVSDNGGGVPEPVRERIFEPFFTTKEAGQGTGLGLSITRQIVEEHGGQIELESPPGGATFRVRLPAAPPPDRR